MDISAILKVTHIKLDMVAKTKEEAIEELTDLLVQSGSINDRDEFIRDVWLREEEGPTGFENHIAIPHGKSNAVVHTALAIGRTQYDIPWETMDDSHIRCIILYAIRSEQKDMTHIRLLTQVSCALADEDVIAQLLDEKDPTKIIDIFNTESDIES